MGVTLKNEIGNLRTTNVTMIIGAALQIRVNGNIGNTTWISVRCDGQ